MFLISNSIIIILLNLPFILTFNQSNDTVVINQFFNSTIIRQNYQKINITDFNDEKFNDIGVKIINESIILTTNENQTYVGQYFMFNPDTVFDYVVNLIKNTQSIRKKDDLIIDSCSNSAVNFSIIGEDKQCPYKFYITDKNIRGSFNPKQQNLTVTLDTPNIGQCCPNPSTGIYFISLAVENPECSFSLYLPKEFKLLLPNDEIEEFKSNKNNEESSESSEQHGLSNKTRLILIFGGIAVLPVLVVVILVVLSVRSCIKNRKGNYILPKNEKGKSYNNKTTEVRYTESTESPVAKTRSKTDQTTRNSNEATNENEESIISGETNPTQQLTPRGSRTQV